jgi:glycosyltransferase involved in cell wall biosynthesis
LEAEGKRTGIDLERPSAWSLHRESREYIAADRVVLTSGFARRSFIAEGVPAERLLLLRAAALLDRFRATPEVIAARAARIAAGSRLRVLFVGSISLRKGFHDYSSVVESLREAPIDFHVIGNGLAETQSYRQRLRDRVHFHERVAEPDLRAHYAAADLFFMPTLEDGGPFTLLQAQANGLPVLATDQCIATDVIEEGRNGWMVRAGDAAAMIERLRHCLSQREELAAMAAQLGQALPQQRDWRDVALELIAELRRLGRKPACA